MYEPPKAFEVAVYMYLSVIGYILVSIEWKGAGVFHKKLECLRYPVAMLCIFSIKGAKPTYRSLIFHSLVITQVAIWTMHLHWRLPSY